MQQTSAAAAAAALPAQPLPTRAAKTAAGRKGRKKGPSLLASNASLAAIVVAEFALSKAFVRAGLTFPASLAGMVGLFAGGEGGGGGVRGSSQWIGGLVALVYTGEAMHFAGILVRGVFLGLERRRARSGYGVVDGPLWTYRPSNCRPHATTAPRRSSVG